MWLAGFGISCDARFAPRQIGGDAIVCQYGAASKQQRQRTCGLDACRLHTHRVARGCVVVMPRSAGLRLCRFFIPHAFAHTPLREMFRRLICLRLWCMAAGV